MKILKWAVFNVASLSAAVWFLLRMGIFLCDLVLGTVGHGHCQRQ